MSRASKRRSVLPTALLSLIGVVAASLVAPPHSAVGAGSSTPPVLPRTAKTVTTDPLPTAQVDGVVKTQVVAGGTVFAGGTFTSARPAGAEPGVQETPRSNLMAYDLASGVMTPFAPQLNGAVKALAVSRDGKTLYAGGLFTAVGSSSRQRVAAFDVRTGALKSLKIAFNSEVNALAVSGSTLFVGGDFTIAAGRDRIRLAAVSTSKKKLTAWAPSADRAVHAMTLTPDKSGLVVGGSFSRLGSTKARGMGQVSATSGKARSWKINEVIKDDGLSSAVLSLTTDKDTVYGTAFAYGGGNFEGAFAARPRDGKIVWLQDCHGDTYSVVPVGDVVYTVGHAHFCGNIGGFPETTPKSFYRALAVTKTAGGVVAPNSVPGAHYGSFAGQPAPSLLNWFPSFTVGTATGASQAAWSITAARGFVLLGGEFLRVNGVKQQGLVRLALPGAGGAKQGPVLQGAAAAPTATSSAPGALDVSWPANYDRDDLVLTHELLRDGTVVATRTTRLPVWRAELVTYTDVGLEPGRTYAYSVRTRDGDGNTVVSASTKVTVPLPTTEPTASPSTSPTPG